MSGKIWEIWGTGMYLYTVGRIEGEEDDEGASGEGKEHGTYLASICARSGIGLKDR